MNRAAAIETLTKELIRQQSISDVENPEAVAKEASTGQFIKDWLEARGISCLLQSLSDERNNVFALVRGKTDQTVILASHFDTVGVSDYPARFHPFEPDTLVEEQEVDPQIYVVGRGSVDMKSGVAVAMVLLDELQHSAEQLNGSVMLVATCDEECNSWGILHAPDVLLRANGVIAQNDNLSEQVAILTDGHILNYQGVINLDYTTERFQDDPDYHMWAGTIGKLLPSILIRGQTTHVGEHFSGFHATTLLARIIAEIDGNMQYVDGTVPPSVLKASDDKQSYNVQTALSARAYFNVFTIAKTPDEILDQIYNAAKSITESYIHDIERNYEIYRHQMDLPDKRVDWRKIARVVKYSEIHDQAVKSLGQTEVEQIIDQALAGSKGKDSRDQCFTIIERVMDALKIDVPTIVLFYAPPFYPYIKPDEAGRLYQATNQAASIIAEESGRVIHMNHYYPYISDMSYLRLEPEIGRSISGLTREMPVWSKSYSIDFDQSAQLDLPVVNVGPYGFGAHRADERVEKYYSFNLLPEVILQTLHRLFQ